MEWLRAGIGQRHARPAQQPVDVAPVNTPGQRTALTAEPKIDGFGVAYAVGINGPGNGRYGAFGHAHTFALPPPEIQIRFWRS